ncbi:MAG: CRISPR system precrRNA processing endoribonuclease RAMP protein Cas6 [Bacteroidales bacterium]|nr:CRISPR system precrRNA processing endoribonuclease RAMP protein Cas6 [Bacteroidales bacterium]
MNKIQSIFSILPLTFTFQALAPAEFPDFPSSMLRGALGYALVGLKHKNGKPILFEKRNLQEILYKNALVPPEILKLTGKKDASQLRAGYWFNPLESGAKFYKAGDIMSFGFTICGQYAKYLEQIIQAFKIMGEEGLGINRKKAEFRLLYVTSKNFDESTDLVWEINNKDLVLPKYGMSYQDFENYELNGDFLKLKLNTPSAHTTEISTYGSIPFHLLLNSLAERLQDLSLIYGDAKFNKQQIENFDKAYNIKLESVNLKRYYYERKSNNKSHIEPIIGYLGELVYKGSKQVLDNYLALILFGQYLHFGNHIVHGAGNYLINNECYRFI